MTKRRIDREHGAARPNADRSAGVLAKAAYEAASQLGLTDQEIADAIGLKMEEVVLMQDGALWVSPVSESGTRCLLLIRAYRSLAAVVGYDPTIQRIWLCSHNHGVGGVPVKILKRSDGLSRLVNYLEKSLSEF